MAETKEAAVAVDRVGDKLVEFVAGGEKITLTPNTVKNYLVSGNKDKVSVQEVVVFMNLCRFAHLNPWMREAYLIKYGSEPATMVVSKEAFLKRAEANKNYDGAESGIIVQKPDGSLEYRKGMLRLEGETIVGGYAEVFRKDRTHSTRVEVSFDEYAGRKGDGSLNAQWSKKPGTMIRKVALAQALRDAFPSDFGGIYTAEEQGVDEPMFTPSQEEMVQEQDMFDAAPPDDGIPAPPEPVNAEGEQEFDITQ